ncbi:unnamed protein product, partial [Polarella glacialis]
FHCSPDSAPSARTSGHGATMGRCEARSASRSRRRPRGERSPKRRRSRSDDRRPVATAARGRSPSIEDRQRIRLTPREGRESVRAEVSSGRGESSRYESRSSGHEGRSAGSSSWSKGGGRGPLAPAPRPGLDEDRRYKQLDDDPRYFEGAELGKAQKAALGVTGLSGRNTASFDPSSTLVRPAMRVIYGFQGKRFGSQTKHDDVVVVPNFLCCEGDPSVFDAMVTELQEFRASGEDKNPSKLAVVSRIVAKMCKYFAIDGSESGVRVRWYRKANSSRAKDFESPGFQRKSGRNNCVATLALGSTCELAFKRNKTGETIYFPQANGSLLLTGRDVGLSWRCGEEACAP